MVRLLLIFGTLVRGDTETKLFPAVRSILQRRSLRMVPAMLGVLLIDYKRIVPLLTSELCLRARTVRSAVMLITELLLLL